MSDLRPMHLRKLRAEMELKGLSLKDVSARAKVPYNTCSIILSGTHVHSEYLERIRAAIKAAPLPKEVAR